MGKECNERCEHRKEYSTPKSGGVCSCMSTWTWTASVMPNICFSGPAHLHGLLDSFFPATPTHTRKQIANQLPSTAGDIFEYTVAFNV